MTDRQTLPMPRTSGSEPISVIQFLEATKAQEAVLRHAPDLAGIIPESEVQPPDDGTVESSADNAVHRRVVMAVINAQIAAGQEDSSGMPKPLPMGAIAEAIKSAGVNLEQYVQMAEDPEFRALKQRWEHIVFVETRMPSYLAAIGKKIQNGDVAAFKAMMAMNDGQETAITALMQEIQVEGYEGLRRRWEDAVERGARLLKMVEPPTIDLGTIAEARQRVETRDDDEPELSKVSDETFFVEE